MYRHLHLMSLLLNPFLGLEHRNSCNKGYTPDVKISYLDPQSTPKTVPDAS